jgi:hypothetical protein
MKIAVLIPDRGDRPEFLKNCIRMVSSQTLRPSHIEIVNDLPISGTCDITYRYRIGYERLRGKGFDLIAFMENDDWYSVDYLLKMGEYWNKEGRPKLLGTGCTIYYHLREKKYFTMYHTTRSSAMNTFIIPDLSFPWCMDTEPYTDIHLWQTLPGKIVNPATVLSIGIKHGVGLCGGSMHVDRMHRYRDSDQKLSFLKKHLDPESFEFYSNYFT